MRAGRLRHRLQLQQKAKTRDLDSGEFIDSWQTQVTVWAEIEPANASEFIESSATQAQITAKITIRFRPGLDSANWRGEHKGTIYKFEGPPMPDPRSGRKYLLIMASTGVSDGS
ncbi:hypothetical protein PHACT_12565 [Pseudohongiella acticola]|uniref:Head-tail adaptor protein n=1 Tax=Pseudohongiella acticola TaxID=1524254 RepID=A0A1E8CG00_9GAMM|nr:hypothetical protein PHACT_12565 [Pseudohongiella acticola]